MAAIEYIQLPTHSDERGHLTSVELKDYVDWEPKRIYYVTDVRGVRGGHAVRGEKKMYVCVQGLVKARIHDGDQWQEFELKGPRDALVVNKLCWREFMDFSKEAVLMAVSNMNYEPEKYIFDLDQFLREAKQ